MGNFGCYTSIPSTLPALSHLNKLLTCPSVCPPVYPSACPSVRLYVYLSTYHRDRRFICVCFNFKIFEYFIAKYEFLVYMNNMVNPVQIITS